MGEAEICVVFTSEQAEDAFDEAFVTFSADLQNWRDSSSRLLEVRDLVVFDGFYSIETNGRYDWIWTGAARQSRFFVPAMRGGSVRITFFLFGHQIPLAEEAISIEIDGESAKCRFLPEYQKLEAEFQPKREAIVHLVSIRHALLSSTSDGSRELGVALHRVRVEAL
ncbi:hypothetical protein D3874_04920 [Oleomonas cavernae]|uniref:Uncharacterized protein n=1 Tax=Oleomonas cavernae TaxID=2320859 RepID=A0A418W8V2_9PROT|nr:hypothetical protein D3874_04920 [Oleomonas cavernae]